LLPQAIAEHLPQCRQVVGNLDEFGRRDGIQAPHECLVGTGALRARSQVTLNGHDMWPVFAVVMQDELIVAEMIHRPLQ
jgi:hypothetical protein